MLLGSKKQTSENIFWSIRTKYLHVFLLRGEWGDKRTSSESLILFILIINWNNWLFLRWCERETCRCRNHMVSSPRAACCGRIPVISDWLWRLLHAVLLQMLQVTAGYLRPRGANTSRRILLLTDASGSETLRSSSFRFPLLSYFPLFSIPGSSHISTELPNLSLTQLFKAPVIDIQVSTQKVKKVPINSSGAKEAIKRGFSTNSSRNCEKVPVSGQAPWVSVHC